VIEHWSGLLVQGQRRKLGARRSEEQRQKSRTFQERAKALVNFPRIDRGACHLEEQRLNDLANSAFIEIDTL
jgi:peroxiredoxin